MNTDFLVIGGGPGGYISAIRAAQLGAKVLLIEEESVGGICLNKGCIPTKALYRNAQLINDLRGAESFGIRLDGFTLDLPCMMERIDEIIERLKSGIKNLLDANGIETIYGKACFAADKSVVVHDLSGKISVMKAKNIIIATGARPYLPPIPGIELPGVITSDEILSIQSIPKSLVVIGGGVIGTEYAGIFRAFGTEVTIIEQQPLILAKMDTEISRKLSLSLKKKGIIIENGTSVKQLNKTEHGLEVLIEGQGGERVLNSDQVFVSTGRLPNIQDLNLELLGIEHDDSGIKVNQYYRTNIPGIYAIGDVKGGPMLAHVAGKEGIAVAENIMGIRHAVNYDAIPECVYSYPEAATIGLSEEDAKEKGIDYITSRYLFRANGKAMTMGEEEGFIKVLAETQTGIIIGTHIIGAHASDLIHEAMLAISSKMTAEDITKYVHAHPTLSEVFMEAVAGLCGKSIHSAPKSSKNVKPS